MKVFKILKTVFQSAAAGLFLLSVVLCGVMAEEPAEAAYFTMISAIIGVCAWALVGIFLISAANGTAQKIGHGLTVSAYAVGLTVALLNIEFSTCAVIMLIAVIMLALYYLCTLVMEIMKRSFPCEEDPNEDVRIVRIREWKKIMEEGIISAEEYEKKRCEILGIKPEEKSE